MDSNQSFERSLDITQEQQEAGKQFLKKETRQYCGVLGRLAWKPMAFANKIKLPDFSKIKVMLPLFHLF